MPSNPRQGMKLLLRLLLALRLRSLGALAWPASKLQPSSSISLFCVRENSPAMHLAVIVCVWGGGGSTPQPRRHCHVAGSALPTMHIPSFFACDWGLFPRLALAFLVRMWQGSSRSHASWAGECSPTTPDCFCHVGWSHALHATRSLLAMQPPASTATAAMPALGLHHRRRHRWHLGL